MFLSTTAHPTERLIMRKDPPGAVYVYHHPNVIGEKPLRGRSDVAQSKSTS